MVKKWLVGLVVAAILLIIVGGGYMWFFRFSPPVRQWVTKQAKDSLLALKPSKFSNREIIDRAYSEQKTTENFYRENLDGRSLYYLPGVINDLNNPGHQKVVEVCANSSEEVNSIIGGVTINQSWSWGKENETEKYSEFEKIDQDNPNNRILYRIHKCNYLDKSLSEYGIHPGVIGVFNYSPINGETVKELAEYLWFIQNYDLRGRNVLESSSQEDNESVKQIIYQTKLIMGDWNMCDIVGLIKEVYSVDKTTGEASLSEEEVKTLKGKCN